MGHFSGTSIPEAMQKRRIRSFFHPRLGGEAAVETESVDAIVAELSDQSTEIKAESRLR